MRNCKDAATDHFVFTELWAQEAEAEQKKPVLDIFKQEAPAGLLASARARGKA